MTPTKVQKIRDELAKSIHAGRDGDYYYNQTDNEFAFKAGFDAGLAHAREEAKGLNKILADAIEKIKELK